MLKLFGIVGVLLVALLILLLKGIHALYLILTLLVWIFFSSNLKVESGGDWILKVFSVLMVIWAVIEVLAAFGWIVRIGG